jgi:D-alanyl-D-alanine carboxypeptidase
MAWDPGLEWTGGGLASTPTDLVVWARALFEGRAMEEPYLEEVLRSVAVSEKDANTRYGAGVTIHEKGSQGPDWGHGGWIPGYCSSLRYYPSHRVAVAFMVNTDVGVAEHAAPYLEEMERRLAIAALDFVP